MTKSEAITKIELLKAEIEWDKPLEYQVALGMAIDALHTQPKWISVDDELPDSSSDVICTNGDDVFVAWFSLAHHKWYYFTSEITVAHWMEFPYPPKKE